MKYPRPGSKCSRPCLVILIIIIFGRTKYTAAGEGKKRNIFVTSNEIQNEMSIEKTRFACINNKNWRFSQNPTINCRAVQLVESRRFELCQINEVRNACPTVCGLCCEDDLDYQILTFETDGTFESRPCEWIGKSIRGRKRWWCATNMRNNGQMVRDACPFTCGACESYVHVHPPSESLVSKTPSTSPATTQPSTWDQQENLKEVRNQSMSPFLGSNPSSMPTSLPLGSPVTEVSQTGHLSSSPTLAPTSTPICSPMPTTLSPTLNPSLMLTTFPFSNPSSSPISMPTSIPTHSPTSSPTSTPTLTPTSHPSSTPTSTPTYNPTFPPTSEPSPSPKPNLVMVITDEHNYRTLSCYRDHLVSKFGVDSVDVWGEASRLETPNIDALASEGAIFTNFYTVAPLCTPSRASFMTGLYPAFTGDSDLNHGAMDSNLKTFATVLQEERGYQTGYFGKWHLDGAPRPGWGDNGRKFGFKENKYRWNRGHFKYIDDVNGTMKEYTINQEGLFQGKEDAHFTTDYLMDRGVEFIERSAASEEPFALVISIPDPHAPNENRPYYRNMFKDRHFKVPHTAKTAMSYNPAAPGWNHFNLEDVPLNEVYDYIEQYEASEFWQHHLQQYYGMVKCIDDNIGKLMGAIKGLGIDEETIIVFTSDHGDLLFEHGKFNKGRPYDTSAGIPFLIRQPGQIPAGKVVETAYSSVDFAPTILSLMGVEDVGIDFQGTDGSDELLSDDLTSYDDEKIIISMDTGKTPIWTMAKLGNYKFVVSKGGSPWLFDLEVDPEEKYNYIDSSTHQDIKRRLQDAIIKSFFEYEAPLLWYADIIFLDKPACEDKKDILPLSYGRLAMCSDIGGKVNIQKCENQSKVRNHCPVACGSCCEDTDGIIIVDGQLYSSCNALGDMCDRGKVASFCPVTCQQCL